MRPNGAARHIHATAPPALPKRYPGGVVSETGNPDAPEEVGNQAIAEQRVAQTGLGQNREDLHLTDLAVLRVDVDLVLLQREVGPEVSSEVRP